MHGRAYEYGYVPVRVRLEGAYEFGDVGLRVRQQNARTAVLVQLRTPTNTAAVCQVGRTSTATYGYEDDCDVPGRAYE